MKLEPPALLKNVYRDLRDKRLLSIAIALGIAIVAVPFLVQSDEGDTAPPPASTTAEVEGDEVLDPAVLTEQPTLRDFRKRLDRYRTGSPFKQQLTGVPGGGLEDLSDDAGSSGSESTSSDSATDGSSALDSASTTDSSTEPEPEPEPSDPAEAPAEEGTDETVLVTTRVDVRFGTVGDSRVIKGVKPLDFLPDRAGAVVEFVQADFGLERAVFIVSPFVTSTEGAGKCAPSPQRCEFLQLEVGKEHSFQYDGERYRLKLLDAYLHEQPLPQGGAEGNERRADFSASAPSGMVTGG